jgi:hypothetical protein
VWKPSVMALFLVNLHIVAISSRQAWRVWPSWTSEGSTARFQFRDRTQEPGNQLRALFLVLVLFQKQRTELLFEAIDHLKRWVFSEN